MEPAGAKEVSKTHRASVANELLVVLTVDCTLERLRTFSQKTPNPMIISEHLRWMRFVESTASKRLTTAVRQAVVVKK